MFAIKTYKYTVVRFFSTLSISEQFQRLASNPFIHINPDQAIQHHFYQPCWRRRAQELPSVRWDSLQSREVHQDDHTLFWLDPADEAENRRM